MSKHAAQKNTETSNALGRLKSLGLTEPWQVALLLPNSWDDLTQIYDRFDVQIPCGESCAVAGRLAGPPEVRFSNSLPRLIGYLVDASGYKLGFSAFGDTRELDKSLRSHKDRVILFGQMDSFDGRNWLKNPEIVPEGWVGKWRPRYPGKTGVIKPDTVRERVLKMLKEAVPHAADFLARELFSFGNRQKLADIAGVPGWSLEAIILQAHVPKSQDLGLKAQRAMEYFAALVSVSKFNASRKAASVRQFALNLLRLRLHVHKIKKIVISTINVTILQVGATKLQIPIDSASKSQRGMCRYERYRKPTGPSPGDSRASSTAAASVTNRSLSGISISGSSSIGPSNPTKNNRSPSQAL